MPSNRQLFYKYLGLPSARPMGLEIASAQGVYLYDPEGKDYIDLVSGVTVSNLGHQRPEIISAIKEQADRHLHLMVYGELIQSPQVRLAEQLTRHLPPELQSVYLVNSGSEAIEGAMKLAKRFTGRTEIAAFRHAYHGGTHGALSIAGDERLKNSFRPLLPEIRMLRFNDFRDLEQISEQTACVVAETVQAEAGVVLPDNGFLGALRRRCNDTGTLLIIDDIQMGMGRTGKLFSFEHYDIIPDILCLAKAFGGGMPLGAFISSREIMLSLTHDPELGHITTFGGHPVSCSAALAALEIISGSGLMDHVEEKATQFIHCLKNHPAIRAIRHKGLMIGVELESMETANRLMGIFYENGIISETFLFHPQTFRIAPPLPITPEEIDLACDRLIRSLDQL